MNQLTPHDSGEPDPIPAAEDPGRVARREYKQAKRELRQAKGIVKQAKADARARIAARAAFYDAAGPNTTYVSAEVDEMTFVVPTGDRLGRGLFSDQWRGEMATLATSLTLLERVGLGVPARERTFVDVGANIGTTTVTAVVRHGFDRALAIEPEPRNLRALRMNVAVNDLTDRVRTVGCAIGAVDSDVELVIHGDSSGKHLVSAAREGFEVVVVRQRTLDEVMADESVDVAMVGLLWMDTQGFEGHVLRGAQRVLERGVPVVAEVAPTPLRRSGGLDLLKDALAEHYTHVIDLRSPTSHSDEPALVPAVEIGRLIDEYEARPKGRFTDVLAVRVRS